MSKSVIDNKAAVRELVPVLPVQKGGTGSTSPSGIRSNLGIIPANAKNAPNGIAGLDSQGKIPMSLIPAGVGTGGSTATIDGPTTVTVGSTVSYTIVGYSSFETYTVVASAGTTTRSGATITYTAPATAQTVTLTVNGKAATVDVVPVTAYVDTPAVTSPTTGATDLGPDVVITGSAFATTGGSDTHEGTDWQIATDTSFSNVVADATNSTTDKTSYTATGLAPSSTYYVRLRYKGTTTGYSNWSTTTSFSTKSTYGVSGIEQVKLTGEAGSDRFGYSVSISATGDAVVVGAYGANSRTGYVKVYKNISGTWTQQGATLTGEATYDYFGVSVSISASGDTIVVGADHAAVGDNSYTGYAKVYKNISGTWTQQGATLTGEATDDEFGVSVSISATGDTIVVGARAANSYRGYVKVYK